MHCNYTPCCTENIRSPDPSLNYTYTILTNCECVQLQGYQLCSEFLLESDFTINVKYPNSMDIANKVLEYKKSFLQGLSYQNFYRYSIPSENNLTLRQSAKQVCTSPENFHKNWILDTMPKPKLQL